MASAGVGRSRMPLATWQLTTDAAAVEATARSTSYLVLAAVTAWWWHAVAVRVLERQDGHREAEWKRHDTGPLYPSHTVALCHCTSVHSCWTHRVDGRKDGDVGLGGQLAPQTGGVGLEAGHEAGQVGVGGQSLQAAETRNWMVAFWGLRGCGACGGEASLSPCQQPRFRISQLQCPLLPAVAACQDAASILAS